jgi:hypothetical protein
LISLFEIVENHTSWLRPLSLGGRTEEKERRREDRRGEERRRNGVRVDYSEYYFSLEWLIEPSRTEAR